MQQQSAGPGVLLAKINPDLWEKHGAAILRFWLKSEAEIETIDQELTVHLNYGLPGASIAIGNFPHQKIAQVGDWNLFESVINTSMVTSLDYNVYLKLIHNGTEKTWIDDVRIQPIDAQMTCYVYDTDNLRLLTTFDDQHFGLYYQYNAEGKLVRKIVETERGRKTVRETQFNIPLVERN